MKIIISPAKKMNINTDEPFETTTPVFLKDARVLRGRLREMEYGELKKLWQCNDKIAEENFMRLKELELDTHLTPAVLSYEGIQYQYMAPQVFSERQWAYVKEHLRILSGLYGVLKPMDGVIPYRLEMQAKLRTGDAKDLYAFWGDKIYRELSQGEDFILNLASKEYSRAAEKYAGREMRFVTCIFGEWSGGKIVQKGTYAKMARGEMVRFLAERQAESPEEAKRFDRLGYTFDSGHSDDAVYVFIRAEKELQEQQVR